MKFISDGTWFDKNTEVKIVTEICTVYNLQKTRPTLSVLAEGLRHGRVDQEMCTMEEFRIVGDDYEFE